MESDDQIADRLNSIYTRRKEKLATPEDDIIVLGDGIGAYIGGITKPTKAPFAPQPAGPDPAYQNKGAGKGGLKKYDVSGNNASYGKKK